MRSSAVERDAYLRAEVTTHIASQIRAIRIQRGWTQRELSEQIGTTQTAVSRIEDPGYGKLSVSTLLDICRAFDIGLEVKLTSFITMFHETYRPKPQEYIPTFAEESDSVDFFQMVGTLPETRVLPTTNCAIKEQTISKGRYSPLLGIEISGGRTFGSYLTTTDEFAHVY